MKHLEKAEEILGVFFFAGMCLLVFVGALTRTLGAPLIWAVDMAQLFFVWAAVLGADVALKRHQHIEIDILVRLFPAAGRRALAILWLACIAAFLAALVWLGWNLTMLNLERELGDAGISYGWVTVAMPVGALLMLITVLTHLAQAISGHGARLLEGNDGTVL
jgi:TRAP-type transport system small permease protein